MPCIHSASVRRVSFTNPCRWRTSEVSTSFRRGSLQPSKRPTTASVMLCSVMLRMASSGMSSTAAGSGKQSSPGWKEAPAPAQPGEAPEPLLEADRDDDGKHAEADQVPGAVVAEVLVECPEDQRADDRAFDAADHDHENGKGRRVDAEGGVRADAQVADEGLELLDARRHHRTGDARNQPACPEAMSRSAFSKTSGGCPPEMRWRLSMTIAGTEWMPRPCQKLSRSRTSVAYSSDERMEFARSASRPTSPARRNSTSRAPGFSAFVLSLIHI